MTAAILGILIGLSPIAPTGHMVVGLITMLVWLAILRLVMAVW